MQIGRIGATPDGGCRRLAFSKEEGVARSMILGWAKDLGLVCLADQIGNLFMRFESQSCDKSLPPLLIGSHIDTVPSGGRFDGVFGVLAGLEAIEAMQSAGCLPERPIEVVIWSNEEGCRYQPGCMGSKAFVSPNDLPRFLAFRDDQGISVEAALESMSAHYRVDGTRDRAGDVYACIEAHIEQGPVLEATGNDIGIVTSIYGSGRLEVEIEGVMAHAGTTPRKHRKDALLAAMEVIARLHSVLDDRDDILRLTVGRFISEPLSPSVVPGFVRFGVDMRHPNQDAFDHYFAVAKKLCSEHRGRCSITVKEIVRSPTVEMDERLRALIESAAGELGLKTRKINSGAGHDARNLASICPTAMIFVPSRGGVSHHPAEYTSPEHLEFGAQVLADVIAEITSNQSSRMRFSDG